MALFKQLYPDFQKEKIASFKTGLVDLRESWSSLHAAAAFHFCCFFFLFITLRCRAGKTDEAHARTQCQGDGKGSKTIKKKKKEEAQVKDAAQHAGALPCFPFRPIPNVNYHAERPFQSTLGPLNLVLIDDVRWHRLGVSAPSRLPVTPTDDVIINEAAAARNNVIQTIYRCAALPSTHLQSRKYRQ